MARASAAKPRGEFEWPADPAPDGPAALCLPADLGFAAATRLHQDLMAVRACPEVVLDAAAVEKISTAAVLVLVSFLNARADLTPPAAVLNASGAFVDAFSELGLFGSLMRMEFR